MPKIYNSLSTEDNYLISFTLILMETYMPIEYRSDPESLSKEMTFTPNLPTPITYRYLSKSREWIHNRPSLMPKKLLYSSTPKIKFSLMKNKLTKATLLKDFLSPVTDLRNLS